MAFNNTDDKLKITESPPPSKKPRLIDNSEFIKQTSLVMNGNIKNNHANNSDLNLFTVKSISNSDDCSINGAIKLKLMHINNNSQIDCYLYDSWTNCLLGVDYIVNVLSEPDKDGNYHIKDNNGFLIVNPHIILSGTTILSALYCLRKSALSWKFRDTSGSNSHMLLGNIMHMLFQEAILKEKFKKTDLMQILCELIKRRLIITQIFESNANEKQLLNEAINYLDSIETWLRDYVRVKSTLTEKQNISVNKTLVNNNTSNAIKNPHNFHILSVCDIEESIWSPKYGFKGKLDLTLQIERHQQISNKKTIENFIIPVELKSGRSTFSVEHEGQVMLYALLNKEKRKTADYGLLLYLKDAKMKFIKANQNNLKGLIQLRNDLVYYISSNNQAELKNDERTCSKCSMLTICSLFNDKNKCIDENESTAKAKQQIAYDEAYSSFELYSSAISHLNDTQKKFFFKWYYLLDLEFQNEKQFDSGDLIWAKSLKDLEALGYTVSNLRLVPEIKTKLEKQNVIEDEIRQFYIFTFHKENYNDLKNCQLKENDMILLSLQSENQIGISQGFIKAISNYHDTYVLLLDKNLDLKKYKHSVFRLDKINYRSAICLNYTNLMKLMDSNEYSTNLREFIIDKKQPTFESGLNKDIVLKTKHLLKDLNKNQQLAVIKALMAQNYLLIKGYPGTGKTSTIAAMIAVFVQLGKKVLFTSFTNSAVDNLLVKVQEKKIDFIRIGSADRIHPEIRKYESTLLTAHIDNPTDLRKFYEEKPLIATTCSSITNAVFNQIKFDYCIVDEASQVLQTTCLGPLLVAKKFVLVGDIEQLSPVIRNKDARMQGMGVSLFEHLDATDNYVELVFQYRMNSEIMSIANEISYDGKLRCISNEVQDKKIKFDEELLSSTNTSILMNKLASNSILFLDTSTVIGSNGSIEDIGNDVSSLNKNSNKIECEIVYRICKFIFENSDCNNAESFGIIAPYNDQVKLLQAKFRANNKLKDIEINTVDQFQGRDKRIILLSFTNSVLTDEPTKEFEILNDKRRLTVAITRAKEKLILIGCKKTLLKYKPIEKLINSIQDKDYLFEIDTIDYIYNLTRPIVD